MKCHSHFHLVLSVLWISEASVCSVSVMPKTVGGWKEAKDRCKHDPERERELLYVQDAE